MKITKTRLKEIIKEEVVKIFEAMSGSPVGAVAGHSGAAKKKEPLEEEDGWDEPHV